MIDGLHWLGGLCVSGTAIHGGLLVGLFVAGAAGSVVHCGPMCGVFVLGQIADRMARLSAGQMCERHRLTSAVLLPYHLGRLTTYTGLGALAAGSAAGLGRVTWFGRVSAGLLVVAAALFLAHAIGRIVPLSIGPGRAPRAWGRLIGSIARRIPRGSVFGEYLFGMALGFLPCGFLYAALAAAAGSAQPAQGAAAMLTFGLGTAPALMAVGFAGQAAGRRWNRFAMAAAPPLMAANALLLLALAWEQAT